MGVIIGILILLIIVMVNDLIKGYKRKKLFELVSWSVIGDYDPVLNRYSYTNDIMFEIQRAQNGDRIDSRYKITEHSEIELVREIVKEFQKHIARLYFRDKLLLIKSKYVVTPTDYFMVSLFAFLSDNSYEHNFLGHDMFGERVEYQEFKDGSGYSATDTLSDYGFLYYKLFNVTYVYCQKSEVLKGTVAPWAGERIKEALETRQIKIIG